MKRVARMSPRNRHRVLGCLAVLHSAAILAFMAARPWPVPPRWFDPLWIGVATLWFFWPVVLLLHAGRSIIRILVPLFAATVIAIPWSRTYSFVAAGAFGLPMGCTLSPISTARYFVAYIRGRADARRDVRDGHIAVEVYGFGAGGLVEPLEKRYHIDVRVVAGCVVDETLMGHARGYNIVSAAEVRRRFGDEILDYTKREPKYEYVRGQRVPRNRPNQSLQRTAGRCDDQLEFMKHIVDVTKARSRQR